MNGANTGSRGRSYQPTISSYGMSKDDIYFLDLKCSKFVRYCNSCLVLMRRQIWRLNFYFSQQTFLTQSFRYQIRVKQPKFYQCAKFYSLCTCIIDSMSVQSSLFYKGFYQSGEKFSPPVTFHGQIPYRTGDFIVS